MKKTIKKLAALLLAGALAATAALPAFAEETPVTHKISTSSTTHTYEIYQIFKGKVDDGQLTSLKYGQNTSKEGTVVSQEDIAALNNITDAGDTQVKDQADIQAMLPFVNLNSTPIAKVGKDNSSEVFLEEGYYLIKDVDGSLENTGDSYTLYILHTLSADLPIVPKDKTTTSEKKIKDINDSTETAYSDLQDSADYDIGDDVPYVLTATLAENVTSYKKYHITFVDTLESGKLKNNKDYVVKVNGTATTAYTKANETDNGFEITLEWGDGKSLISDDTLNEATVTVEFTAELLETANIGSQGNINTSYLKFSNNPNSSDGGEEGRTPDDKVIAFTYKLTVNKVDEDNKDLDGATFSLYKKYKTAPTNGTACTETGYTDYYLVKKIVGTSQHVFEFKGIDDGDYVLVEDVAPTNYNKIGPQAFTVSAEHDIEWTSKDRDKVLTSLTGNPATGAVIELSATPAEGDVSTTVVNKSGATLPSTGGMGTTIFYVIGGILVLAAAIILISRRRVQQ